jgi:Leucine-rich repeat (LRR) protein
MNYKKLTLHDLKSISRENHIKGYSLLNKEDLIKHIKKNLNKKKKMNGGQPNSIVLNSNTMREISRTSKNQYIPEYSNKISYSLSAKKIISINPNAFNGFTKLEKLILDHNKISELKVDTFNRLTSLKELDLKWNSINIVEPGAFNGLINLKILVLRDNKIKELKENTFNGLSSLEKLDLQSNSINIVKPGVFNGLSSLKELYLGDNKIEELKENTFNELSSLEVLYLSSNKINKVEDGAFKGLSNLKHLFFRDNVITKKYKKENITKAKSLIFRKSIFEELQAGVKIYYGSLGSGIINTTT